MQLPKGKLTPVVIRKEIIEREPSIIEIPAPTPPPVVDMSAAIEMLKNDPEFLDRVKGDRGEKGDPGLGIGGEGKSRVQDLPGFKQSSPGDAFGIDKNGNVGFFPRHELGDISVTVTSTSYTAVIGTPVILVDDETAGDIVTVTLPNVYEARNMMFYIKKLSNRNNVVIDGNGSELIDGDETFTLIAKHESVRVYSNGSFWSIV